MTKTPPRCDPSRSSFRTTKWIIPSHHSYPADAEQRLANTAAALMELRKDMTVSGRIQDHSEYGVIDPIDTKATTLTGRGKRVTLRDENNAVSGRLRCRQGSRRQSPGTVILRVPSQRRTYAVKTDADVSAEFADWIETDLLKINVTDIRKISINRYSINERRGTLENQERNTLTKRDDKWRMSGGAHSERHQGRRLDQGARRLAHCRRATEAGKPHPRPKNQRGHPPVDEFRDCR